MITDTTKVGAEKYRQMRANGETPLPKFTKIESGKDGSIPSRDKGRDILTRIFEPEGQPSRGVYLHIHGKTVLHACKPPYCGSHS